MSDTPWYKEDLTKGSLWKAVFAESLATLLFVLIGCGSLTDLNSSIQFSVERVAFTFGLAIASLVQVTGAISGGHINPAVSLSMMVAKKISPQRCGLYILAQVMGAIVGASILYGLTPSDARGNLGANQISRLSAGQGFGCEVLLTFLLVLVIFAATDPYNGAGKVAPLAIGLAVTVAHLMGVPYSGASMNPARSFGPAVLADKFANHWIYWVGPLLGGPAAALVYKYLLRPKREKDEVLAASASDTELMANPGAAAK